MSENYDFDYDWMDEPEHPLKKISENQIEIMNAIGNISERIYWIEWKVRMILFYVAYEILVQLEF